MNKTYTPCGGCGAEHPDDRCIGCGHQFEEVFNPDLLKVTQEAEATKESDLQKLKEEITPEPIGLGWVKAIERLPSENGGKYFVKFRESKCVCHYYNGHFQSIEWGLLDNNALIWLDETGQ